MDPPDCLVLRIRGPIRAGDLPGLSVRICALFAAHPGRTVHCDVRGVPPDAACVDALARLQLVAKRNGCRVRLHRAEPSLLELVAFMGLGDVLPA